MGFNINFFIECLQSGIRYLPETMKLTFIPILTGLVIGTIIAAIRVYKIPVLGRVLGVLVTLYQGVPIVVALLIFNLIFLTQLDGIFKLLHLKISVGDVDNIWVGIIALSMSVTCWMEESIKGAFFSIDKGQYEAGYSVGLTRIQTLRRIIIPQILPVAIPMLTNNIVGAIKGSSIVMAIGITEILSGSVIPSSRTYSFLEGYVAAAVIFWGFTLVVEKIAKAVEKRSDKYRRKLA